ncbi:MAG: dienelactone hydrolase family protein, partial [Ignavibacteriales bacterium]|nr:dienelactone hydrolase family protein [Ignavibacteriales bacterium]
IRFPFGGYTWYDLLQVGKPEPHQFAESHRLLAQFITDVKRGYPLDPSRVFLFGFSMGSMMSLSLALSQPNEIRGVVAHSGFIPEEPPVAYRWNEINGTSFFVAHGEFDPVVPVSLGRRSEELLKEHRADYVYREYPIEHSISEDSLADAAEWLALRIDSI